MKVNITKHPTRPGWYYVDYRPEGANGKRCRDPVEGYEKAVSYKRQLEAASSEPDTRLQTQPRIKDVVDEYLAWVKRNQAPATYDNKVIVFRAAIIPHFGEYRVKNLSQRVYDDFHVRMGEKRKAIILYQAYLGAMIKWMHERGMAPKLDFTPGVLKYHRPVHTIPHPEDMDKVIDAVQGEDKQILFKLMLLSGMRWNEASNIRWEQIDLKAGSIRLVESLQESNDVVPIPDPLFSWFKANKKLGGWVFLNPQTVTEKRPEGLPYGSLKKCLKNACDNVGVHIHPHLFRHASATYLYAATGDIKAVQAHLRQKDIRSTLIYIKYTIDQVKTGQKALILHMNKMKQELKNKTTAVHVDNNEKPANAM